MLSFQGQYELFQDLASDDDATNLTMGKKFVNLGNRKLQAILGRYWNEEERSYTIVTDAISGTSDQAYYLPENFKSLTEFYVTISNIQYPAELIQDEDLWRRINAGTIKSTSAYVQFIYIKWDRFEIWPLPATGDTNTGTFRYRTIDKDLSVADYVTGTITTLANGGVDVTGSGSTWIAKMVGRYFKITDDEQWYKIASRSSNTAIKLTRKYQGVGISSGSDNYTIGQIAHLPPNTHELAVYYAVWKWALFRKDVGLAREYERMWKEGVREAQSTWANRSSSNIIRDKSHIRRGSLLNPNWYPRDMTAP